MYQLSDLALEAILKEWHPEEYDPPHTDIREWIHSIESLCDTYGIPDVQRPQSALGSIKEELRTELVKVLAEAREKFGPVHWDRFKAFMFAFDRDFREQREKISFYRKYPKLTGAAIGITGGILLAPVAAVGSLLLVGLTPVGIAAGFLAVIIQPIIYGGAAGGLFSLLRPAGATTVLSSKGTSASELLHEAADSVGPGGNPDDDNGNPPPYHALPQEYCLKPQAILAIVKSWDVGTYNPPGTNCTHWLYKIHNHCERYGIPVSQRALCAMHRMRTDCKEAAHAAECYDMTWDGYTAWLHRYDDLYRRSANRRIAELSVKK